MPHQLLRAREYSTTNQSIHQSFYHVIGCYITCSATASDREYSRIIQSINPQVLSHYGMPHQLLHSRKYSRTNQSIYRYFRIIWNLITAPCLLILSHYVDGHQRHLARDFTGTNQSIHFFFSIMGSKSKSISIYGIHHWMAFYAINQHVRKSLSIFRRRDRFHQLLVI